MPKSTKPASSVTGPGNEPSLSGDIRFRKLIENSYEGITLLDKDLNVIYRSPSAERIAGWNTEERTKSSIQDLIHPDDVSGVQDIVQHVVLHPSEFKTCTFRVLHAAGNFI